jgi:hypothetical protein
MRFVTGLGLVVFLSACAAATVATPATVLRPAGTLPDTIDCDHPLIVTARTERQGIDGERAWLDAHYPNHSRNAQALLGSNGRKFDVLTFEASDGPTISVCFDITSFFGKW